MCKTKTLHQPEQGYPASGRIPFLREAEEEREGAGREETDKRQENREHKTRTHIRGIKNKETKKRKGNGARIKS